MIYSLDSVWATALRRTLTVIVACAVVVAFCYFLVDRQTALFIHRHAFNRFAELRWLTKPPPFVQVWSPLLLVILLAIRAARPWRRWQSALFVACISLIVADQVRESLGDLCGRYWPETWYDNNPSLIGDGAYGFHPFRADGDSGSFPSGHAARIVAFLSVFWAAFPRGRWFYAALATPLLVALVAVNYHFVSDVVAGGVLGGIVGGYAVILANFDKRAT